MSINVIGTGAYLPPKVVSNLELATMLDLSPEWIERRTGIKERRFATEDTLLSMAVKAAQNALENTDRDVEFIVAHSSSVEESFPSLSSSIAKELGIKPKLAFDLVSGCTGFLQALLTASSAMEQFNLNTALVVASEHLSKHLDFSDRDTAIIFGDGAGAIYLEKSTGNDFIIGYDLGTMVERKDSLSLKAGTRSKIKMRGTEVFRFAVRALTRSIENSLKKAGISPEELDFIIPHQSNSRILESANKILKIPEEKIISHLTYYGNTGSASIPIAIDLATREGKLKQGQKILFTSYGAGLSWTSLLVKWRTGKEEWSCILETVFQGY